MSTNQSEDQALFWRTYWHLVCHRSEVAKPRDYVLLKGNDEEIAIFHDGRDVIAFDNRCPHRGTRIFDGDSGNAPFLCPYHGWTYSKGRLFIGRKDQFTQCAGPEPTLNQYHTAWVGDFLFVAIAPGQRTVEDQLGDLAPLVAQISSAISGRYDLNCYDYECVWQVAIENALEPYHVSVIHPNSLGSLRLETGVNRYVGCNSVWETTVGDSRIARNLQKLSKSTDFNNRHEGYQNIYLFPYAMISSTFGVSFSVQNFFPSTHENKSHFYSRLYPTRVLQSANPAIFDHFFASTSAMNRTIFLEDAEICKRIPESSWVCDGPSFYADAEERLVHFRQTYRAAIADRR